MPKAVVLLAVLFATAPLAAQKPAAAPKPPTKDLAATTPEQKAALELAKSKLGVGWDYFVQPDCVVLFDFDVKHPDTKTKAQTEAKAAAAELTAAMARFRVDAPPPATIGTQLPILRVFRDDADEKAFLGAETRIRQIERGIELAQTGELCARHVDYAWLWYQRLCLGEDIQPERWFRVLCAARYRRMHGDGKTLTYDAPDLSKQSAQIATVALGDALTAMRDDDHLDSFLGALADLLERGPKLLGKDFDPAWSKIVPAYMNGLLAVRKDLARKQAFAEVDADKLEAAVKSWASKKR